MSSNLETRVNEMNEKYKRVMVTGDYHIPFMDEKAYNVMKTYAKHYKPDIFVINGDLLDFYGISQFDKNPERCTRIKADIEKGKECIADLRKILPKHTEMYLTGANHESRFQKYLWKHAPELYGIEGLTIEEQLKLPIYNVKFVKTDNDYWKSDTGHLKLGNTLIMHGDNRLNGASTSKYSGYSVKNTMLNGLQQNVIMGHVHRLAQIYHTTPYGTLIGMESGCLCKLTGTANWQQGFTTFELHRGKMVNPELVAIEKGKIYKGGKIYLPK
jgi:metallophosphoesterase superfamily enzyme